MSARERTFIVVIMHLMTGTSLSTALNVTTKKFYKKYKKKYVPFFLINRKMFYFSIKQVFLWLATNQAVIPLACSEEIVVRTREEDEKNVAWFGVRVLFIFIFIVECGVGRLFRKVTGGGLGSVWMAAERKRGHHSRSHSKAWQCVDIFLFSVPNETVWWLESQSGLEAAY